MAKPEALLIKTAVYGEGFTDPPDPLPQIHANLPFTHVSDSAWNRGTLNWKVADSVVRVTDDDGNELGSIEACFGGFLEIHIQRPDGGFAIWRLDPRDAWYAVTEALDGRKNG